MGLPVGTQARLASAIAVLCCALGLLPPATAQAAPTAQQSIIGGETAAIADLPSLAFIEAADARRGSFDCTGTVIAPRVVLTAAHCAENLEAGGFMPASDYLVVTGQADLRQVTRADAIRVQSVHVYPEFDPGNLHGDAAVLVLATPTPAPSIPLATSADSTLYAGGATVRLAGWGLTRGDSSAAPSGLRTTTTVVQDPASCKRRTLSFNPTYSPAFQLCTQNPPAYGTGGCFGDSGGPVIAQRADGSPVEIGVVSTGGPFCNTKLPNIFTRADRISTWAAGWIAAAEAGAPAPGAPQATVPPMPRDAGEGFITSLLVETLGERFLLAEGLRGECRRLSRSSLVCWLDWIAGPNLYAARITAFYAVRSNAVVWDNHYLIKWVNGHCWLDSGHRGRCAIHSRHR